MIVGIGVDSVEIERVVRACKKEHFRERVFTKKEREQFDRLYRRAASDFAGKEAVVKMFGTGFAGIEPSEIAVLRKMSGEPYVELYGNAKTKARDLGIEKIFISITNTKELAMAFVTGTTEEGSV